MLEERMDRREQSKVLTSSGKARTEKVIQQKLLPSSSDRGAHQQNSKLHQPSGHEAERSCRSSRGPRGEFDPSKGRCTLHTPVVAMTPVRPPCSRGDSKGSEHCSSDSEASLEREPPVKNDIKSARTDSDADSGDDGSSSDSSSGDSSSSGSSGSSSTSSNDDLNSTAPAKSRQGVVAAGLPRNNLSATTLLRASEESLRIHADQDISSSSCNAASIDADLYYESMSLQSCDLKEKAEKEQVIEEKVEEIPVSGSCLSSKQLSDQQMRPRVSKPSIVTGAAADSSTENIDSAGLGMHSISVDGEYVSHIPLPSASDGGSPSMELSEEPHQRNLVRIVLKKSGVTRGISAKKLTKNPVINIFGEIVFDGCTFEGESRSPAERAADILKPSELVQRELDLNSEEIRNRVCNDILQKEIRLELGEGRGRSVSGDDILQNGIRRETGERRGRDGGREGEEEQGEVDRQKIFDGSRVKDEGRSSLTVGKLNESRNDSVRDNNNSKNLQKGEPSENLTTKRFSKRLVDYEDDDDAGSGHGIRSKSEDEDMSDESSSPTTRKDDREPSDGARSGRRNMKRRPELTRSFSRKRRHSSSSTSSSDERGDSVDGSEHPESTTSEVRHGAEVTRNCDGRSSLTNATGRSAVKTSDKKFSDLHRSDSQPRSAERGSRKRDDCDRSESQPTGRNLARGTTTSSKSLGTIESTNRETIAEVERDRKVKTKRSDSHENLEVEENDDDGKLERRESRRSTDSLQPESLNKRRMSSPQIPRSSARTFSPDCDRPSSFSRHHKQEPRCISPPTRPKSPADRNPKSRRSETRYEVKVEARGSERRRRSIEGPDDFTSGTERLEKRRQRSRSSDRHNTEQHFDDIRNVASISKSTGVDHKSTKSRSEQSGKTRSRSNTAYDDDDVSNRRWNRQRSSTSTSFRPCPPEESCFRGGHGGRDKTRSRAENPSPRGGQREGESGTTRSSNSAGRVSNSEGMKRTGEDRGRRTRGSKDRTDVTDDCSHNDNDYQQSLNYYPNGWMWSPRGPGRLKDMPDPYQPYPYLHPFAQPFASPMLRCNPYVYANYFNGNPRRYYMAQQPSPFYPNYHRPQLPYWTPPGPHNLHHPSYGPYEAPAGQGEGGQYEEEGECQYYGVSQDENQDRSFGTADDVKSLTLKVDQRLLGDGVTESITIQSSTDTAKMESDACLGAAAATEVTITEEEHLSSPESPPLLSSN